MEDNQTKIQKGRRPKEFDLQSNSIQFKNKIVLIGCGSAPGNLVLLLGRKTTEIKQAVNCKGPESCCAPGASRFRDFFFFKISQITEQQC